ncbi:MAG: hypothetical protein KKG03_01965 [Gammaproteobacteria bacterium]|nr:hypothetical protein [Sideroxydans sp.]MBU3904470.1 hypothetical protein [Gammaproteobacteria bacterium]MBU4045864.1 hypothetical protein [Gammaproteobacteria bacterium]MBU4150395.1 hypothetical protein [Gammaproteobacteria bacterium]
MLTRLALFVSLILALPFAGSLLSGGEVDWHFGELATQPVQPLLISLGAILALFIAIEVGNRQRSLLKLQRHYLIALSVAGAVSGWLLLYMNRYAESWLAPAALDTAGMLTLTLLFALLLPTVLGLRTLLAGLPGLLQRLARLPAMPSLSASHTVNVLAPLALLGLIGGAAWPELLFWLMWLAPLLLLIALQALWHERSIFAELATGDWGRVLCAALSGLLVSNVAVLAFRIGGGTLIVQVPNAAFAQLGYALFGLLSLQLGDVIAEYWRGKTRGEVFKRKSFPIPVVTKKEQ